ncbi:unnamed protein product [Mytilus coruscus]|uniref:MICOS complex subunit MIC13 n=1 Tax=Mytilus coruscus TaxID=42192 RepID=A0A6J8F119_MYTCO|nr:unnamed protein product [Mytilus coruscus]
MDHLTKPSDKPIDNFLPQRVTKLAIGGAAVYVTVDQGVWKNSQQASKAAEKVRNNVLSATNEYSKQIVTTFKKGINEDLPKSWNSGVQLTFSTLAETPEYSKKALISTKDLFRCRVFGGHLAEIQDAETDTFLQDNARLRHANDNDYNYFIGLTDEAALDEWEWVQSATKPNFTNWGDNQPDHQGNDEHCVFLYAKDHYRWHDVDCDDHDLFICEEEEMNAGGNIIG